MRELNFKSIIVPFDYSDDSQAALDKALDISSSPSEVHVVHVIPDLNLSELLVRSPNASYG